MKTNSPTYEQIAADWSLWIEYIDPAGIGSEDEFNATPINEKINFIISCFGSEISGGLSL